MTVYDIGMLIGLAMICAGIVIPLFREVIE